MQILKNHLRLYQILRISKNYFQIFITSILIKSVRDESSLVAEHLKLHDTEFIIMSKHFVSKPHSHEMRVVGGDLKEVVLMKFLVLIMGKHY